MAATRNLYLAYGLMAITNGQLIVGKWKFYMEGPPAWGLVEGLTSPHCKKTTLLRNVTQDLGLAGSCNHSNEASASIKGG
jgi:hypothetical protein